MTCQKAERKKGKKMVRLTLAAPKQAAEEEILDPSGVGASTLPTAQKSL